jgi:hypothetical protein
MVVRHPDPNSGQRRGRPRCNVRGLACGIVGSDALALNPRRWNATLQHAEQYTRYGNLRVASVHQLDGVAEVYSGHSSSAWMPLAGLLLYAAYESKLCAAILNAHANGNRTVFLTLLGGGAFGNLTDRIADSIRYALYIHRNTDLDVAIFSYGTSRDFVRKLSMDYSA